MYKAKKNIWDMDYTDNYEKVCSFIDKTRNKITKIKKCYNDVKNVLKQYIDISNKYSEDITSIALQLLPSSDSVEGKLIQAIQGILLFNSEAIENLVKQAKIILTNFKASKESNSLGLEDLSKLYQINFSNVVNFYCNYIAENELYEKYLIHKELGMINNQNENKSENNQNQLENINDKNIPETKNENNDNKKQIEQKVENNLDNKIDNKQTNKVLDPANLEQNKVDKEKEGIKEKRKSKERKDSSKILQEIEKLVEEKEKNIKKQEILYDNHEKIFEIQKIYLDFVDKTNDIIKKLIEFGWNEIRLLKTDFYNNCLNFVNRLLECVEMQKNKYFNQSEIIKELNHTIQSEKEDNFCLESQLYSLHCLSIYMNKRIHKRSNMENFEELTQKGDFDNELYKNLGIEHIGNIIQEMQKNSLTVKKEDLKNYEIETNLSFIEKNVKLIIFSDSELIEEEKNKIIELFKKDKEYILFFLQKMNNDRSRGGKILNIKTYHRTGELFRFINNIILEKNDFECFRYVAILCMTFYTLDGDKKIYIYEYIKDHPNFKQLNFWKKLLETLIDCDLKNVLYINKKDILENKLDEKKEEEYKKNFATFSNVLTVINNMTDFGLEKELVEQFINYVKTSYSFEPAQIQQFEMLLTIYEEKINEINTILCTNNDKNENNKNNKINESQD